MKRECTHHGAFQSYVQYVPPGLNVVIPKQIFFVVVAGISADNVNFSMEFPGLLKTFSDILPDGYIAFDVCGSFRQWVYTVTDIENDSFGTIGTKILYCSSTDST